MRNNHEEAPPERGATYDLPKEAVCAEHHGTGDAEKRAASDGEAQELEVSGEEHGVFERADDQHQAHSHGKEGDHKRQDEECAENVDEGQKRNNDDADATKQLAKCQHLVALPTAHVQAQKCITTTNDWRTG